MTAADDGWSGTDFDRPGFQRMMKDALAGKIDMIITKSISRFARNTVTLLKTVRELKLLGIDVFFEENKIHSLQAEGEVLLLRHRVSKMVWYHRRSAEPQNLLSLRLNRFFVCC